VEDPVAKKAYYSIGEVCEVTGLRPHVLRYWETQFQALHPTKNRAGNRVYRPEEVETILLVKRLLYEEKYTIGGADRKIRELRSTGELREERKDSVEPELLSAIRGELLELRRILTPLNEADPDDERTST